MIRKFLLLVLLSVMSNYASQAKRELREHIDRFNIERDELNVSIVAAAGLSRHIIEISSVDKSNVQVTVDKLAATNTDEISAMIDSLSDTSDDYLKKEFLNKF